MLDSGLARRIVAPSLAIGGFQRIHKIGCCRLPLKELLHQGHGSLSSTGPFAVVRVSGTDTQNIADGERPQASRNHSLGVLNVKEALEIPVVPWAGDKQDHARLKDFNLRLEEST